MPQPKEYSPQSHGDTEKNKVKGKTGAHGGGGGHGGAGLPGYRCPRGFGSGKSSWRANSRNRAVEAGVAPKSLRRARISNISSTDKRRAGFIRVNPCPSVANNVFVSTRREAPAKQLHPGQLRGFRQPPLDLLQWADTENEDRRSRERNC